MLPAVVLLILLVEEVGVMSAPLVACRSLLGGALTVNRRPVLEPLGVFGVEVVGRVTEALLEDGVVVDGFGVVFVLRSEDVELVLVGGVGYGTCGCALERVERRVGGMVGIMMVVVVIWYCVVKLEVLVQAVQAGRQEVMPMPINGLLCLLACLLACTRWLTEHETTQTSYAAG